MMPMSVETEVRKKLTNTHFFQVLHEFIASELTFEFISKIQRCTMIHKRHILQNKPLLMQQREDNANGAPCANVVKT